MTYVKKLFIHLTVAMVTVWVLVSISTFIYKIIYIEQHIKQEATNASNKLSKKFMQMNYMGDDDSNSNMQHYKRTNIIKDTHFHLFSITEQNGNVIVNETSNDFSAIQRQIKKYNHEFNVYDNEKSKITVMHGHDNNTYYLDIVIPWKISKNSNGVLHTLYDGTHHIKEIYDEWFKTIIESMVVMLLFLIAGYPTVLLLQRDIIQKNKALSKTNIDILNLLGGAIAKRDSDTHVHNFRVTLYALLLGEALKLTKVDLKSLIKGAFLHDVGKIGISDTILLKPNKLTDNEFEVMKQHVRFGEEIIINSEQLNDGKNIVLYHHEKYDGSGYLKGLKGEEIPLNARIFAIADVFDALTSKRPYKEPFTYNKSKEIMHKESGSHFDPKLITLFFDIVPNLYNKINSNNDEKYLKNLLNGKIIQYFD